MTETPDLIPDEEESGARRRLDPELRVLSAMLRMLDELGDDEAKARVINYLAARFDSQLRRPL